MTKSDEYSSQPVSDGDAEDVARLQRQMLLAAALAAAAAPATVVLAAAAMPVDVIVAAGIGGGPVTGVIITACDAGRW